MELKVQTETQKGITVVAPRGRLILQHGPVLHNEIKRAIEQGARRVLIDLSGVDYIDSFGLGQMVACMTTLRRHEGQLRFAGLSQKLLHALEMTKVPTILTFDPDRDAALGRFTGS